MKLLFEIFFQAPGTRPWIVLCCLMLASTLEGFGIATLLPLLNILTGGSDAPATGLEKSVVDTLGVFGATPDVGTLLLLIGVALVAKGILTLLAMRYVGNAAAEMATEFRRRLTANILNARWAYLITQPMGQIANTISVDVYRTAECYVLVANLMTLVIQTFIFAIVAFVVSWELAVMAMALGLLMTGALHWLVRMARQVGYNQTVRTMELVSILSDSLNNLKPIRAMGRESGFAALLNKRVHKLRRALRKTVVAKEAMNLLQEIIIVIILVVGIYLGLVVWEIPLAEITVAGLLLGRIVNSVGKVQKAYQKAATLESAYTVVNQLCDDMAAQPEAFSGHRTAKLEERIEIDGIDFAHEKLPVLHNVSMEVSVGELTVLLGPSGAGKTTIVDTILRLHEPQNGTVLVDGIPLSEIDLRSWRSMIGYVPQELLLLHDTIGANITLGDPSIGAEDIEYAMRLAGCLDFVNSLPQGLDTDVGEKGAKLSGGQRQRIALARALAKRPRLLILDEVTSALDPTTGANVARELANAANDVAILSITHRPEMLAVADRIYKVENGRVFASSKEEAALE